MILTKSFTICYAEETTHGYRHLQLKYLGSWPVGRLCKVDVDLVEEYKMGFREWAVKILERLRLAFCDCL
jgi:hypothetical protein